MVSTGVSNEILILWIILYGVNYKKQFTTKQIRNIEHLRQRLLECWDRVDQRQISSAIGQWRRRASFLILII